MNAATLTRDPFMPQAPKVRGRAISLAVLAHVLLIVALAFGVNWRSDETATVAAELWSATPQAAAPRAAEPEATPAVTPPPPRPEPKRAEPVAKAAEPAPEPRPALPDPQIALEKAQREDARRRAAEQEQKRAKAEKAKAQREEAAREKEELALKRAASEKAERAEKAKADAKAEKAEKAEAARLAALREANLKRLAGLAGASGGPADTGTALRSSAHSANYGGRVAARVKPNIVLTEPVDGNPVAEVEVRLAPDGTIVGKRLTQSSGSKAWDDAVLRAIERTEILPLDNGRAPAPFVIRFRPRD
jgi:colicin import membrane protein